MTTPSAQPPLPIAVADAVRLLGMTISQVQRVIAGQEHMVQQLMVALLTKGHCLLEGIPGVTKTLTVRSLVIVVGGDLVRVQFTPNLVPSDIVGTHIHSVSSESFEIELGPVFMNFVLVDEINQTSMGAQSAMLELMAEKQVSTGGRTYPTPRLFIVVATQNPVESEGAHPLPEAQRGRFPVKVGVPYPKGNEEFEILRRVSVKPPQTEQVLNLSPVCHLQDMASKVFVHNLANEYIICLILATRDPTDFGMSDLEPVIQIGYSPRVTFGLVVVLCSLVPISGRDYMLPTGVQVATRDVIFHRIVLGFDVVADNVLIIDVVDRTLTMVPAPTPVWNDRPRQQRHQRHGHQPGHA